MWYYVLLHVLHVQVVGGTTHGGYPQDAEDPGYHRMGTHTLAPTCSMYGMYIACMYSLIYPLQACRRYIGCMYTCSTSYTWWWVVPPTGGYPEITGLGDVPEVVYTSYIPRGACGGGM